MIATKQNRRMAITYNIWFALMLIFLFMFVWLYIFRDYWIGQEARYYFSGENFVPLTFMNFFISPDGSNTRPLSMYFARVLTEVFGPNIAVINTAQIVILGAVFFLLFSHS